MKTPTVSVIMPVWNGARYLNEAVQSVLNQKFKDFELIIVDDASTDETSEILGNLIKIDSRITVITNEKNIQLPASLNVGFRHAKGDWLTWTSDDNIMEKDCLEILTESVKAYEAKFVFTDYKIINSEGAFVKISKTGPAEDLMIENTVGACFLYGREIPDAIGEYAEDKFMFEDYEYWVRISRAGFPMMHLGGNSPYRYRIHNFQLSQQRKLPAEFVVFRYSLIREITDNNKKVRAYLAVLRLSIRHRIPEITFKSLFKISLLNPLISLPVITSLIIKRIK